MSSRLRVATWQEVLRFGSSGLRDRGLIAPIAGGAGSYPDVPNHRIEYDRDGSAVINYDFDPGTTTELTNTQRQEINDEDSGSYSVTGSNGDVRYIGVIFPELRDIAGYLYVGSGAGTPGEMEKSSDTTNLIDGTWATVTNPWTKETIVSPNYRDNINSISALAVNAIRFKVTGGSGGHTISVLHLYGSIASGETKYLTPWRPSSAASVEDTGDSAADGSHLDWGDTPRSSSQDRKMRIKNEHGSLTANSVSITIEALTDTSPSVPGQYLVSTDGMSFSSSINLGNLGPGVTSSDFWVRRNTDSAAVLGVWSARIIAKAGSWS